MVSNIDATKPADGVSAVKGDLRQNLAHAKTEIEALQAAQAAFPTSGFTGRRNRLINGNMYHTSRGVPTVLIPNNAVPTYNVDRWYGLAIAGGAAINMARQLATEGIPGTPHNGYIRLVTATPKTPVNNDYHLYGQTLESPFCYDLKWGGSAARPLVLSFLARASITGQYAVRITPATGASYIGSYTINASNTWEQKSIAIPGPTIGAWDSNGASVYMRVQFDLGTGASGRGAANTWTLNESFTSFPGAVNICANTNAFLDLTGVQLEQDTVATPWEMPQPILEALVCARYYQFSQWNMAGYAIAGISVQQFTSHLVQMRANPTVSATNSSLTNVNTPTVSANVNGFVTSAVGAAPGGYIYAGTATFNAEIA